MTETELERIVVRLVGDGTSYQAMMQQAAKSSEDTAKQVQDAGKKIEGMRSALVGFAGQALGALGAFGVASSLRGAFESFSKLEEGQIRLRNIIVATGQALDPTITRFLRFAGAITETTNVTKGEVMMLLQRATAMGLNAEQSEKVSRNAIALAGITGRDAGGMIRIAAAIERGNYQMARRVLGLQGVKDETELVRIVNNMMTAGMRTQTEFAETAAGKLERLGRAFKFMGTEIGGIVATAIMPFIQQIQKAVEWFKALDPFTKQATTAFVGLAIGMRSVGPTLLMLKSILGPLLPLLQGLPAAMLGPWGLVAAGVAVAIVELGGIKATWQAVYDAAMRAWKYTKLYMQEFISWAQPIFNAFGNFMVAVWNSVVDVSQAVWSRITSTVTTAINVVRFGFAGLSRNATMSWNEIRDVIVEAMLRAEWIVRNFGQSWDIAVTATALAAVQIADTIVQGLYGAFNRIREAWQDTITFMKTAWRIGMANLEETGEELGTSVSNWLIQAGAAVGLIDQQVADASIRAGNQDQRLANERRQQELLDEVNRINAARRVAQASIDAARAANTGVSQLQRDLQAQLDAQMQRAMGNFERFRRERMADGVAPAVSQKQLNKAEQAGEQVGGAFAHGVKTGMEKLDAVARFSAEAFGRISAYRDRLMQTGNERGGQGGAAGVADVKTEAARVAVSFQRNPAWAGAAGMVGQGATMVSLLGQIAATNRVIAAKNVQPVLAAANLGG
jgi:hypothetical protein